MLICNVVGSLPNFLKITPIVLEMRQREVPFFLVHTGHQYEPEIFLKGLGLPESDICLGVDSDAQTQRTADIMAAFERVCQERRPDMILAGGDVTSTLAVALVAAKEQIPLAHVEAGLRSFDRTMPGEVNRVITDHLADLLFTTEEGASENLKGEGIDPQRVHFVGNCLVDTLQKHIPAALQLAPWKEFGMEPGGYALITLHRPSFLEDPKTLALLLAIVNEVSRHLPVIFAVQPRARQKLSGGRPHWEPGVNLCEPLPYLHFVSLMARALCVLTDSGRIQEEATALQVPCLTLSWNTERPITLQCGTNRLVGTDPARIMNSIEKILAGGWPRGECPPLWDGRAAKRIVDALEDWKAKSGAIRDRRPDSWNGRNDGCIRLAAGRFTDQQTPSRDQDGGEFLGDSAGFFGSSGI